MRADADERARAGQAVYTPWVLAAYDLLVLRLSNRLVWRCPWPRLLDHYGRHVGASHLDAGVGTGFFLDRCRFPTAHPRLALLDMNPDSLAVAGRRLARYRPMLVRANVLGPVATAMPEFASIGLNYLLHCLPGPMAAKGEAVHNLARWLLPGGVMFGATLLHGGVRRSFAARRLMAAYNARGIFDNVGDDADGLRSMLRTHLDDVAIEVVGCAALFSGRARHRDAASLPARDADESAIAGNRNAFPLPDASGVYRNRGHPLHLPGQVP